MVELYGNLFFLALFFSVLLSVYYLEKIRYILKKTHTDIWFDLGSPELGEFSIVKVNKLKRFLKSNEINRLNDSELNICKFRWLLMTRLSYFLLFILTITIFYQIYIHV